jgi:hypothetical protein
MKMDRDEFEGIQMSLDTVKMFAVDAKAAGFSLYLSRIRPPVLSIRWVRLRPISWAART